MMTAAGPKTTLTGTELERLRRMVADTVRGLAMDAVQKANSGHPGMPMGMADAAVVLWTAFLKHNPAKPQWPDRDRFVLSAGHGSMLLYSLLHLSGYDLPMNELQGFRQWGSLTPGHPEYRLTPGVETTTGPLGQGISNAVGMALAEKWMAAHFNRPGFEIVNHHTYVIASDGDLMEGISHESCALGAHLALGKLIVLYDDNGISIDGPTSLSFSEDVLARFSAYGWHTQHVDGHHSGAVECALLSARAESRRPSIIACKTHIGFGSPNRQDSHKAHGEPLGSTEVRLTKEHLGCALDSDFCVDPEAAHFMRAAGHTGAVRQQEWEQTRAAYSQAYPELAATFEAAIRGILPRDWDGELPTMPTGKPMATRAASGMVIDAISQKIPTLLGGSADLTPSNNTQPKAEQGITRKDFSGRYLHFGVREHGMGAILNGLALHGGVSPYGGTFLIFSDYMRPAIRLAAVMDLPVTFVFTHDSIGLGEDGPTHQPIEQLTGLRAIPDLAVMRPADATETVEVWRAIVNRNKASALVLTRQAVPVLDRRVLAPAEGVARGAYVLRDIGDNPEAIIIATGSEVHLALAAQEMLAQRDITVRVVSMPCCELFDEQAPEYRESILPAAIRARVAVEAGATIGWARYTGLDGEVIGLDRFGASAPYQVLFEKLGFTPDTVVAAVLRTMKRK
jgi:transketolase